MRSRVHAAWHWQTPTIGVLVIVWLGIGVGRWRRATVAPAFTPRAAVSPTANRLALESELDSLVASLDTANLRYDDARRYYKKAEALITFYSPTAAGVVDGPEPPAETDGPPEPLGRPAAFEVVRQWLHAGSPRVMRDSAMRSATRAQTAIQTFRAGTRYLDVRDTAALEAARLELARVATVGIAGAGTLGEAATALDGVRDLVTRLSTGPDNPAAAYAAMRIAHAASVLRADTTFDSFDRFTFISRDMLPAARALLRLRRAIDGNPSAARRLWRASSASPYDEDAFDPWALTPEYARDRSAGMIALGARLFTDSRLSGRGDRSCAFCHQPSRAFSDGLPTARPTPGTAVQLRNTPTLINAALQPAMFADMRAGFVEDQIRMVLASPGEMASSLAVAAARIGRDTDYATLVGRTDARRLDERTIAMALAAYVRSLTALRSPFDRAIRGDESAVDEHARRGFNLFMGKARCATCHVAPLFGGTVAPEFARSELEIIGVPSADVGRMVVTGSVVDRGAFRVPSVRNSAVTAPYMHNGSLVTLREVIDFYDRGGGGGAKRDAALTLSPRALHLSSYEKRDLIAFLQSLTDTAVVAKP